MAKRGGSKTRSYFVHYALIEHHTAVQRKIEVFPVVRTQIKIKVRCVYWSMKKIKMRKIKIFLSHSILYYARRDIWR